MEVAAHLKTIFVIAVTTSRMIFPGLPAIPDMPDMSAGAKIKIPDFASATKTMTMNLISDKKVDKNSTAQCAVPEDLKVGTPVKLTIDLPVEGTPAPEYVPEKEKVSETSETDFKMKTYWGCSEEVRPGQPKVIDSASIKEAASAVKDKVDLSKTSHSAWQNDESHAYWPGSDGKMVSAKSVAPGEYKLTTNYCGGTSLTLAAEQDFLAPIELVGMDKPADLEQPIKVEWKSVPNAAAYLLTAFGGTDKETIMWTSSEDPEWTHAAEVSGKAISKKNLETWIKSKALLPANATSCMVPRGIFKGCDTAMLMITAIGNDKIQAKDGIETNVVIRSTANLVLGTGPGGAMADVEANVDMEDMEDVEDMPDTPDTPSMPSLPSIPNLSNLLK